MKEKNLKALTLVFLYFLISMGVKLWQKDIPDAIVCVIGMLLTAILIRIYEE